MPSYSIDVAGMQCAGCENIIESELKTVRGTHQVDADYKRGTVEVRADAGTRADVEAALDDIGYEVQ